MKLHLFLAYIAAHKESFSDAHFSSEASRALQSLKNNWVVHGDIGHAFLTFFQKECEPFLDSIWDFFTSSLEEKKSKIASFVKSGSPQYVLGMYLLNANSRELQSLIWDIYKTFGKESLVTIRSPRPLNQAAKKKIRDHLKRWVIFEVDTWLVWWMLMYRDGSIIDKSFSSFLSRIPLPTL